MIKVMLSTSVIFLVIVAVRKWFRGRAGNVFLYSLWLLFAAGLFIPVVSVVLQGITGEQYRVESPVSIMNLVKMTSLNTDKTDESEQEKDEFIETGQDEKKQKEEMEKEDIPGRMAVQEIEKSNEFSGWAQVSQVNHMLLFIWAAGGIAILLCQILTETSLRRKLQENREEINYQGQKVYLAGGIKTPLLFRGRGLSTDIYLPDTMIGNETLIRHAILHENIHRKHGDIWWGYIRNFLIAVYWFYPLVWIAAVLSKRDCEYACDSSVMKGMDTRERISYGNSLLSLIQIGKNQDFFSTATTMRIGKSEMEVRIRMIKKGIKRNVFVTFFVLLLVCAAGIVAFTDAKEPEQELIQQQEVPIQQPEQETVLFPKAAEFELTDTWGTDEPYICYEDNASMIFSGYFGLFVYSKERGEIVQSLNLKEIGCDATQGDTYCEIYVSEDGRYVYLHVISDKKMYQYSVNTEELRYLDYKLPDKLYDRNNWEKTNKSGIRCKGSTIGDLIYWYENGITIEYRPLFYAPYGSCGFFGPEEIRDLSEVSVYACGKEYVITDTKKLEWIEGHFSDSAEEIKGGSACPFYHIMYLKRKDGVCGKLFPATDSCPVYKTGESYYDYKEKSNEEFWDLFEIEDMSIFR